MSESTQAPVEEYPPYSGEEPTCPKCFYVGARTQYMQYGRCSHFNGDTAVIGMQVNERQHRSCLNCSYSWDEAIA